VKIPAKYRKWRTPNKIIAMVLLTWIIPISLFFISIFGYSFLLDEPSPPGTCDVWWISNVIFSVTLVFSYFWSTLTVIIVLYIFIYQVARNMERKSREKQRKITSLVGGGGGGKNNALVNVVALSTRMAGLNNKVEKVSKGTTSPTDEADGDDFNTDSNNADQKNQKKTLKSDASQTTLKTSSPAINKTNANPDINIQKSPQFKMNTNLKVDFNKNNNNNKSTKHSPVTVISDDISSSVESHSDYYDNNSSYYGTDAPPPTTKKNNSSSIKKKPSRATNSVMKSLHSTKASIRNQANRILDNASGHKNTITTTTQPVATSTLALKPELSANPHASPIPSPQVGSINQLRPNQSSASLTGQQSVKPRPETLAVISVDLYKEKCNEFRRQSSLLCLNETNNKSKPSPSEETSTTKTEITIKKEEPIQTVTTAADQIRMVIYFVHFLK
jgi:hypothetical protein